MNVFVEPKLLISFWTYSVFTIMYLKQTYIMKEKAQVNTLQFKHHKTNDDDIIDLVVHTTEQKGGYCC